MSPPLCHRLTGFCLTITLLLTSCRSALAPAPLLPRTPVSSSALALSPDGAHLAAVNPDSDSTTLVDVQSLHVIAEIKVGRDPRTLAFTPDGALVLVANRGSDSLSIIDAAWGCRCHAAWGCRCYVTAGCRCYVTDLPLRGQPYGVVADADFAYVSLSALEQIAVIDLHARAVVRLIAIEPFPTGLALAGDSLYVTHLYSSRVTWIDLRSWAVKQVIAADDDANLSQFIALSPDGQRAYLPQTRSNSINLHLTHDSTVFPVVSVIRTLGVDEAPDVSLIDLHVADRPVNLPFAASVSPDGKTLYVANAGSDDVSAIDLATGRGAAHLAVGRNPRGLALSPDGSRLYVNNTLDGTLSIFDLTPSNSQTSTPPHTSPLLPRTLAITTIPLPEPLLTGKRLFHSARPPMSIGHWISCASCHFDGGSDGRTWLGFPDGPRDTPALFGVGRTPPFHWTGDLDELQDVELTIRQIQHGDGLLRGEAFDSPGQRSAGRSPDLDALAAYLASLEPLPSPYANGERTQETQGTEGTQGTQGNRGTLTESARRGEHAFRRWGCAGCHAAPLYTDRQTHKADGEASVLIDTPSLLGIWATAPYFHDGSAATLRDTLFAKGFHSMGFAMGREEVEDLVAFLKALPYREGN